MRYLGIDPGASGGFAMLDDSGVEAVKMPKSIEGIYNELQWMIGTTPGSVICVLEHVWTSPQMGVVSAGSFMFNFGAVQMALVSLCVRYQLVAPMKWQRAMGVLTPKDVRKELGHKDKNISKRKAQELFPAIKVTHALADALLLAEYARRESNSRLPFTSANEDTHGKAQTPTGKARGKGQTVGQEKGRTKSSAA